jgi:hypothetical protein
VASLEKDNLVVFYYLSAFEIWSDKRCSLCWERPFKRGTMVLQEGGYFNATKAVSNIDN